VRCHATFFCCCCWFVMTTWLGMPACQLGALTTSPKNMPFTRLRLPVPGAAAGRSARLLPRSQPPSLALTLAPFLSRQPLIFKAAPSALWTQGGACGYHQRVTQLILKRCALDPLAAPCCPATSLESALQLAWDWTCWVPLREPLSARTRPNHLHAPGFVCARCSSIPGRRACRL